jgi:hypothetical protein
LRRVFALAPLLLALAACIPPPQEASRQETSWLPAPPASASDSDRALAFYYYALSLKGGDLAKEYEKNRAAFEKDKSSLNRVRLAVLLSLPSASFRDDAAALSLLQPLFKDGENPEPLRPLAALLQSHIHDMKRADDALQAQSGKLRDEQRRAEALQHKLEALLEMEMKMIEREQAVPAKDAVAPAKETQPPKNDQQRQSTDRR